MIDSLIVGSLFRRYSIDKKIDRLIDSGWLVGWLIG